MSGRNRAFVTVVSIAGAAVWLLSAAPVLADGPTITPLPFGPPIFGSVCNSTVPVEIAAYTDNDVAKIFYENGQTVREIVTGALKLTFTNLMSGKSIVENLSGPGFFTFNPDGSQTLVMTGLNAGWIGDLETSGRIVVNISPTGVVTVESPVHHSTNLCTALS